ncbi:iron ABC transporter permease [Clostridium sp. AF18-27]|uniref:Iron(III) transport system permease protein n=1 Tax=Enterocloster lavalensis TaxID=460384 RepID=A0A1I0HJG1_9FIRM|nr:MULTISPECIES: iron ABC transporter permease [Enterocloster]MBS5604990.1 iron ABC transporter permease [Enterocloster asparagiformis]RHR55049.1 iron ABC transporter permease [Clostridium sp. AF18-27]MCB6346910.1 iron ABC transporter permease [Enterocloster lavalensis]MDR3757373.1 iron ABC transporter permease [Enterocloster sp.]PST33789.1 iron ABC transporter permease [Enterocloster lavalensis]
MDTEKKYYFDIKWFVILAIVAFLVIFQVLPLLYLIYRSFFADGSFSLEGFKRIYSYPLNWTCLKNTLITAGLAMVFGVLLAFPLAWLVGRTNLYGKKFFRTLFVMTYMVPPYVGAMAWLRLLNPTVGTLNTLIMSIFRLESAPFNIYSIGGLVWVLTTFYYPYAFITISRAMEKMDPSLEEASRISGASPFKTLMTVTLPLMLPSIVAAALLVFVAAASCYGIPSIIGAPGQIYTVTTRIVDYVYIGSQEGLTDATNLAVFLMAIALIVLYVSNFVVGKREYITVSGKSTRPNIVDLGKWRIPITVVVSLFAIVVVAIPFATVFMTSFTMNMGKSIFETGNITFKYWHTILTRKSILGSGQNSLISAAWAASLGMIICLIMAYLLKRTNVKGKGVPDFLITVGSGSPSVVIALALIMTMSGRFGINIYNTMFIMVVAYMIKYMMMGMRTVVSAFSQISPSLEEAAQISGSGWIRRLKDVVFPLIVPSIVAGWFLIFMPCFYELTMSNLLYSNNTKTLGVELFTYQTYHSQQTASALASGILIMVIVLNYVLNKVTKGKFSI